MKIDVWGILRRRYTEKEYVLMKEVSDAAGFNRSNSADFIIVNLWPSRGLEIIGIELKSFRSDWLNELKKPDKAENIFKNCDRFYLLTTDETIAKIDEIPINWGWMCIKGGRITVKKEAPKLTPVPLSRDFAVAMLKRAHDKTNFVHKDSIQDEIFQAKEYQRLDDERETQRTAKELSELKEIMLNFEKESGINLREYRWKWQGDIKKTGEAVKLINSGGAEKIKQDLIDLETTAKEIVNKISEGIKNLTLQTKNEPSPQNQTK